VTARTIRGAAVGKLAQVRIGMAAGAGRALRGPDGQRRLAGWRRCVASDALGACVGAVQPEGGIRCVVEPRLSMLAAERVRSVTLPAALGLRTGERVRVRVAADAGLGRRSCGARKCELRTSEETPVGVALAERAVACGASGGLMRSEESEAGGAAVIEL